MLLERRDFLGRGIALGSLCFLPRLSWARGAKKPDGARTLVLLHLRGGNDGLNTVVPYTDPRYKRLRPGLAVDRPLKIHKEFGLHPRLDGLAQQFKKERVAIVHGVGYPQPSYSHFRSTEIYYTGDMRGASAHARGWLGRAFAGNPTEAPVRAVAFEDEQPLAFAGASTGVVTMRDFKDMELPESTRAATELYRHYEDNDVARRARAALDAARQLASLKPARGPFLGSLGNDLRKTLALLRSDIDVEVIHLSLDGFDTHAKQAGAHADLMWQLGQNLGAFQTELDRSDLGKRVTTFVFSEFGRRARENLSGGTDHGAAYPAFVLGNVRPGFHGRAPSLDNLDDDNLRFTVDFRRIYATMLRGVLGVDPKPLLGSHAPLELLA
ncbi:MAG: DUF1501 domain-containing protein [Planctomycetota bacterium]|jgi:uncharacterized protein (DUF1501 family)